MQSFSFIDDLKSVQLDPPPLDLNGIHATDTVNWSWYDPIEDLLSTCSTKLQSDPDEYAMVDDTCVKELEEVLMLTQDLPECKASREANSMPVTDLQPGRREELARRLRDKLRFARALRTGSDRQLVEAELVGFRYQELPENLSSLKWTAVWCKSQQEMIKLYKLFGETRDGILPPLTNRKVDLGKMRTKGWYPPNFVFQHRCYAWFCRNSVPENDPHAVCAGCEVAAGSESPCTVQRRCPVCQDSPAEAIEERHKKFLQAKKQLEEGKLRLQAGLCTTNRLPARYHTHFDILIDRAADAIRTATRYMYACVYEIDDLPDEDEYDHRLLYERPQATLDCLKGYHKQQISAEKLKKKLKTKQVTVPAEETAANQPEWLRQLGHQVLKAAHEGRPTLPLSLDGIDFPKAKPLPPRPAPGDITIVPPEGYCHVGKKIVFVGDQVNPVVVPSGPRVKYTPRSAKSSTPEFKYTPPQSSDEEQSPRKSGACALNVVTRSRASASKSKVSDMDLMPPPPSTRVTQHKDTVTSPPAVVISPIRPTTPPAKPAYRDVHTDQDAGRCAELGG